MAAAGKLDKCTTGARSALMCVVAGWEGSVAPDLNFIPDPVRHMLLRCWGMTPADVFLLVPQGAHAGGRVHAGGAGGQHAGRTPGGVRLLRSRQCVPPPTWQRDSLHADPQRRAPSAACDLIWIAEDHVLVAQQNSVNATRHSLRRTSFSSEKLQAGTRAGRGCCGSCTRRRRTPGCRWAWPRCSTRCRCPPSWPPCPAPSGPASCRHAHLAMA